MRTAALSLALLAAAAAAFAAPAPELNKRVARLLRDIRRESGKQEKNVGPLRDELKALLAEGASDDAAAKLSVASRNLELLESGAPLPPPDGEDDGADEDAPAKEEPAEEPAALPEAPEVLHDAVSAGAPGREGVYFDHAPVRAADAVPVGAPPAAHAELSLTPLLDLPEGEARHAHLRGASARLLAQLERRDPGDAKAAVLARRLHAHLAGHRHKGRFASLGLKATPDARLHLLYRLKDGGDVDEDLGPLDDWCSDRAGVAGGRRGGGGGGKGAKPRGKRGAKGGGGGDEAGGGGSGRRGGGRRPKAGGPRGFSGGAARGEGGGGAAGGRSAFRGGRGRGARVGSAGAAADGFAGGAGGKSGLQPSGRGSRAAGRSGAAGTAGSAASGPASRGRIASVPLPRNFPRRKEQSLPADGRVAAAGGERSAKPSSRAGAGAAGSGFQPGAGWKGGKTSAPVAAEAAKTALPGPVAAAVPAPLRTASAGPVAAPVVPHAPAVSPEPELHDAVAASAAGAPRAAPAAGEAPAQAPIEPVEAGALGLMAGGAALTVLGLLVRRKRDCRAV